ncbi:MAG: ATP-binding protein, partial [Actinomycetes bacterium]
MPDASGPAAELEEARGLVHLYETMLANISDTVVLVDRDANVTVTAGLRYGMLGYGENYWTDHSLLDVVHPDDVARVLQLRDELEANPGTPMVFTVQMQRHDGIWLDIEVTAVDCTDDPLVDGIVLTVRDVTERLRTRRQLEDLTREAVEESRRRVELVGRVSHELRNPVHALQGLVELLITTELPATAHELVRSANRQTSILGRIVDDLLEYSRLEAGRPEPEPRPTDLRSLVDDATELANDLARPEVIVRSSVSEDVPTYVMVDGPRVSQVLSNLVTNAAKFTPGGSISINVAPVRDEPGRVRLEVVDTGTGIASADLERLWRPFEQGTSDAVVRFGGAGLGLAITRGLVDLLGGTVTVDSAVGAGSRFAVDLPAPVTEDEPRKGVLRPDLPPGARVLVVEDNPTNQLLVQEQLARLGVDATLVDTGEAAVDELRPGHPYSMVLMDWQLPGIDGLEATRQARAAEPAGTHVPIVAMTASAMPADTAKCRDAGMDDLLAKPVGLEGLSNSIQRWAGAGTVPSAAQDGTVAPGARIDPAALDELAEDLGG